MKTSSILFYVAMILICARVVVGCNGGNKEVDKDTLLIGNDDSTYWKSSGGGSSNMVGGSIDTFPIKIESGEFWGTLDGVASDEYFTIVDTTGGVVAQRKNGEWDIPDCKKAMEAVVYMHKKNKEEQKAILETIYLLIKQINQ